MNAAVSLEAIEHSRAIHRRFTACKPVNWIKNPPPATVPSAPKAPAFTPFPNHNAHVVTWIKWRDKRDRAAKVGPFEVIKLEVCERHGLSMAELESDTKTTAFVLARQEAAWRGVTELGMSLSQIGRRLGNRDHSTILHGVRQHAKRHGLALMGARS